MEVSAGRAIVDVLKAEGVKAVFGIPGGHTLGIYDALYDTPEVRHILVRHEQVAGNMAAGYAQLTGQPGVCCVTAGPGATNLVSAIAEAFVGALPIVILAGRGATTTTHRARARRSRRSRSSGRSPNGRCASTGPISSSAHCARPSPSRARASRVRC